MCGKVDETIKHMISKCRKLVQKENKYRHEWVGKEFSWTYARSLGYMQARNGIFKKQKMSLKMILVKYCHSCSFFFF